MKLVSPAAIVHARNILAGRETRRVHVGGLIVKTAAPYNPPWHYHLDPASIEFFELTMEVCDAGIRYIEDHLDEVRRCAPSRQPLVSVGVATNRRTSWTPVSERISECPAVEGQEDEEAWH